MRELKLYLITVKHQDMGEVTFVAKTEVGKTSAERQVAEYLVKHFGLDSFKDFEVLNIDEGITSYGMNRDMLLTFKANQVVFLNMM